MANFFTKVFKHLQIISRLTYSQKGTESVDFFITRRDSKSLEGSNLGWKNVNPKNMKSTQT